MKKAIIIVLIVISTVFFGVLVYAGLVRARGVPVSAEEQPRPRVAVPALEKSIDLSQGIDRSFWDTLDAYVIDVVYQIMILPWPKPWQKETIPQLKVRAFHNHQDIYFYLEWEDRTEDKVHGVGQFSDASAVMFPLDDTIQTSSLMMGFLSAANIWQWKASQDRQYWLNERSERRAYVDFYYPFEQEELFVVSKEKTQSAVNDLVSIRVGTVTPNSTQTVNGRGRHDDGVWRVVFKRSLATESHEVDIQFEPGEKQCVFAIWNGSNGDRGGRKSISNWVVLDIQ